MDFFVSATSSTVHLLLISTVEFCKIPFCPWLVALLTLPFFFCFAYYRAIQILRLYIYNNSWLNPTPTLLCQGVLRGHNRGMASNGKKCYQIKFELELVSKELNHLAVILHGFEFYEVIFFFCC